jgi:hypothetical protein
MNNAQLRSCLESKAAPCYHLLCDIWNKFTAALAYRFKTSFITPWGRNGRPWAQARARRARNRTLFGLRRLLLSLHHLHRLQRRALALSLPSGSRIPLSLSVPQEVLRLGGRMLQQPPLPKNRVLYLPSLILTGTTYHRNNKSAALMGAMNTG